MKVERANKLLMRKTEKVQIVRMILTNLTIFGEKSEFYNYQCQKYMLGCVWQKLTKEVDEMIHKFPIEVMKLDSTNQGQIDTCFLK